MGKQRPAALAFSLAAAFLSLAVSHEVLQRPRPAPRVPDHRVQPVGSAAPSAALVKINSCDNARAYLVEVGIERVLEYRYGWLMIAWSGAEEVRETSDVPSDYTNTNTQEQGVDEIDIVKTNGTHLFAVEDETLHILRSWPAEATSELAAVGPGDHSSGLFLRDDRVLLASYAWSGTPESPFRNGGVRLDLLDVSTPSSPSLLRTIEVEGHLVDARLIEGDLYTVIRSHIALPQELWDLAWRDDLGLPELPWDATEEERERILDQARSILEPYVEEIMGRHPVDEMLPRLRDLKPDDPDRETVPLLDCGSLYRPAHASNWAVLSILHFNLDENGPVSASGLIADGWTVYASKASLYVAQTSDWWRWGWWWTPTEMKTAIHKFELDPSQVKPVRYVASGAIDGWILDQFALSEHDGYLRVASTEFDWWWGTTRDREAASSVSVLEDDGRGCLREVGHVGGLGPGERIFAVRFMGPRGYVVTFEQIDPLFTLDLTDPTEPKVVGELEVTGFSSYLHPIGNDWLLAVGQEADEEGRVLGLAVSVFDIRDFADPQLAHRYLIEGEDDTWSWSDALSDHHAFTYHRDVLSIPIYIGSSENRFSGLLVLAVEPEEGIWELGRIDHHDLTETDGNAWMRRSVYIEDAIYSLSSAGVKVNSLHNPEVEIARVPFGE